MYKKTFFYYLVLSSFFLSGLPSKKSKKDKSQPKNIILFIGDGMGLSQLTAARIWAYGCQGSLEMEKFPISGFVKTYSSSDYVTDSAAAATSLASGVKTYNGSVGMRRIKEKKQIKYQALKNIFDVAKEKGMKTGLVTTTSITHATPAAFYAHVTHRSQQDTIAKQLMTSKIDLALGGGRSWFYPYSWNDPVSKKQGRRSDKLNLVSEFKKNNWHYVEKKESLLQVSKKKPVLGLFAYKHLKNSLDKGPKYKNEPSLSELVDFAIKHLSDDKQGYILMVEGGRIDHAAHNNDTENMLANTISFDQAIGIALKKINPKETLLLVTADHETGGLAINGYASSHIKGKKLLQKSLDFRGRQPYLLTFATGPGDANPLNKTGQKTSRSGHYLSQAAHTGVDVPILAKGPGADQFSGFINNTDIAQRLAKLIGGELKVVENNKS